MIIVIMSINYQLIYFILDENVPREGSEQIFKRMMRWNMRESQVEWRIEDGWLFFSEQFCVIEGKAYSYIRLQ